MWRAMCFMCCLGLTACASRHENVPAAMTHVSLGVAYLQQHEVVTAKQHLLLALKEAPDNAFALDSMGYFFEVTGEARSAQAYYQRALKDHAHRGSAYNNYGVFLCREGQYQMAYKQFETAAESIQFANPAIAYQNAAMCARREKKLEKAVKYEGLARQHGL